MLDLIHNLYENNGWRTFFLSEINKGYFRELNTRLILEKNKYTILPSYTEILKPFKQTPLEKTKVIILKDEYPSDPLHVFDDKNDMWAQRGVLTLYQVLSTRRRSPGLHKKMWRKFVKNLIQHISDLKIHLVFILEKDVHNLLENIDTSKHLVLRDLNKKVIDNYLELHNQPRIKWTY